MGCIENQKKFEWQSLEENAGGLNLKKNPLAFIFYFIRKYVYFSSHKATHFFSECSREFKVSAPNAVERLL